MVSIACNHTSLALRLPNLLLFKTHNPNFSLPSRYRRKTHPISNAINSSNPSSSQPKNDFSHHHQQQQLRTLFPGGFKRAEIKVPTVVLKLGADEVLRREDGSVADAVSAAVSKGVGIVVLESSKGDDESGGRLYEAACVLKSVVGDRAYLLISERVDIATAVGASGVLLSDRGLPPIVARNMMMKSKSDTVYLPLVARIVKNIKSAVSASRSEGADFLIMSNDRENFACVLEHAAAQHVKVPIFFDIVNSLGVDLPINLVLKLLESGAPGIVMSIGNLKLFGDEVLKMFSSTCVANRILQDGNLNSRSSEAEAVRDVLIEKKGLAGFANLDSKEIQLIESERLLLMEAVAVIQEAAPMMKEVGLLVDAASRLTESFLLVIVGEFNSGKSTIINALLGRRYLKEGVIPTTNEITWLCYSEKDFDEQERCQRHPDGQFICFLSAPILKNMNLVDTPGTNVILQRQQRLTEEFVPRADLILFVLSSDRPLTESEILQQSMAKEELRS